MKKTGFIQIYFIAIVSMIVLGGFSCSKKSITSERYNYLERSRISAVIAVKLSSDDKQKIDQWVVKKDRNTYGDGKYTFYAGGSPLYNDTTGLEIDRYEYILINNLELVEDLELSVLPIFKELSKLAEEDKLIFDNEITDEGDIVDAFDVEEE